MKKILSITILLSWLAPCQAQDTPRYSLEKIFTNIDNSYPQLQQYGSKISSIRALVLGAKAWMPPTVSVALDRFPYKVEMIKEKEDPMNQSGIMVSIQQMIPNPSKLNAKRDYLASLEEIQLNDKSWQLNALHYTAKVFYYHRYSSEKKLKLVNQYRNLLNLLIKTAKDKYAYNQSDLSTIFKAEASLSELANMEVMLLSQIAESNIGLNTLMNQALNQSFDIDTSITLKEYHVEVPSTIESVQTFRSDIVSMESQIKSMQLNQKLMATSAKPDFGIQLSHGQMFGMPNQFSIMGMMTVPFVSWSSKMYKSEVRSMGFEIEVMQKQKATMELMARQMISEKLSMLKYERKQLSNYDRDILPAYKKNLESNLLSYGQNTGNFFVLLDAWNMLLMKEMERVEKEGQVFTLLAEYEYQREIK
jgi:outer membrane protein TolC